MRNVWVSISEVKNGTMMTARDCWVRWKRFELCWSSVTNWDRKNCRSKRTYSHIGYKMGVCLTNVGFNGRDRHSTYICVCTAISYIGSGTFCRYGKNVECSWKMCGFKYFFAIWKWEVKRIWLRQQNIPPNFHFSEPKGGKSVGYPPIIEIGSPQIKGRSIQRHPRLFQFCQFVNCRVFWAR